MYIPEQVNSILEDYISRINAIEPLLVQGIYLTGSVPLGDYYPKKSDIDFFTILTYKPTKELLKRLHKIHLEIEVTHSYPKFNGFYLTMEGIKNNEKFFPSFFKNKFYPERHFELNKFSLWELKTSSYTAYGTAFEELPLHIERMAVIKQLHQNINSYWRSWIKKYSPPHPHHILLISFPILTEWGILGVSRQLYTLETGSIASKSDAGKFLLGRLPANLKPVMLAAIETRESHITTQFKPSLRRAQQTLYCMKFIIDEFNRIYRQQEQPIN